MTTEVAARFAWGTDRLRAWALRTFASAAPADRETAERAYATLREPAHPTAWPALFAFEEQFGGLDHARADCPFASAAWLHDVPRTGRLDILRINRRLQVTDPATDLLITPDVDGSWLAQIWRFDIDTGEWIDETGAVFRVNQTHDLAFPVAVDAAHFFEKSALTSEIYARRGPAAGDFFVEIDGEHAGAIARAASVPAVPEASDAVSRYFWDGTLVVRERPKCFQPLARATQLASGDLDRLVDVLRLARPTCVRIIGWPSDQTHGFAKRLAADAPEIDAQIGEGYR